MDHNYWMSAVISRKATRCRKLHKRIYFLQNNNNSTYTYVQNNIKISTEKKNLKLKGINAAPWTTVNPNYDAVPCTK